MPFFGRTEMRDVIAKVLKSSKVEKEITGKMRTPVVIIN